MYFFRAQSGETLCKAKKSKNAKKQAKSSTRKHKIKDKKRLKLLEKYIISLYIFKIKIVDKKNYRFSQKQSCGSLIKFKIR